MVLAGARNGLLRGPRRTPVERINPHSSPPPFLSVIGDVVRGERSDTLLALTGRATTPSFEFAHLLAGMRWPFESRYSEARRFRAQRLQSGVPWRQRDHLPGNDESWRAVSRRERLVSLPF